MHVKWHDEQQYDRYRSVIDNDVTNHVTLHAQPTTTFVRKCSQPREGKEFQGNQADPNKAYRSNEGTVIKV